jgi:hypothetical protein
MTVRLLMAAAVMASGFVLVLATARPRPHHEQPLPQGGAFQERWAGDAVAATKADREPLRAPAEEPPQIEPEKLTRVAQATAVDIQPVRAEARRRPERNVCTRHGMRKVVTRGGRSWRCRR